MRRRYQSARKVTVLSLDVDGDRVADTVIEIDKNHTDFTNFVL